MDQPLPRYPVTPLPSFAGPSRNYQPSFSELCFDILRWLRRDAATLAERQTRDAFVNRLAAEFDSDQRGQ
jgi:hypothetical protein